MLPPVENTSSHQNNCTFSMELEIQSGFLKKFTIIKISLIFRPIYLAILGRVYNVDGKKEYYGPGKSYHHFAGRDATRAFTTGDFQESGLIATTHGLSHDELLCEG